MATFERELALHGPRSLRRSQNSLERNIRVHMDKSQEIRDAGGNPASVEREIVNWLRELEAIRRTIRGQQP
jgi:hypothetical protein